AVADRESLLRMGCGVIAREWRELAAQRESLWNPLSHGQQPVLVSVTLFQAAQSALQQGNLAQAAQWARQIDWRLLPDRLAKEAVELCRVCDIPAAQ
ncbi:MAG: hypothetical protein ACK54R_02650, partial [Pirellulaceae bacterium]